MSHSVDRAQSESLSSLLLVAVVIISVGTFGAYYVASTTDGGVGSADGPDSSDLVVEATQDELRISHNGGSSVSTADLRFIVENASGGDTYAFADGAIQGGDGDDRFDPGETWLLAWNQSSDTEVTVALVDDGEDRLLFRQSVTVESETTERPANLADGEKAGSELGAGGSTATPAPARNNPSEPWLDFDDDGIFESQDGDVTVDLSDGTVPYSNASSATLNVPADVTVNTGNDKVALTNSENIKIAGTVTTQKQVEIKPSGYVNLVGASLDNTGANGVQSVTITSQSELTADGLSLQSNGQVSLASKGEGSMTLSETTVDNAGSDSAKSVGIVSGQDIVGNGLSIQSNGQVSLTSSKESVKLSDVTVDNAGSDDGKSINIISEQYIAGDELSVLSNGQISLTSNKGSVTFSETTINNAGSDDGKSVSIVSSQDIVGSESSIQSNGQISLTSNKGSVTFSETTIDNAGSDDGKSVDIDSSRDITGDNLIAQSKGQVSLTSNKGSVSLPGATIDNAGSDDGKSIDIDSNQNITGDGLSVWSNGQVSITSGGGSVILPNAIVDNAGSDDQKQITISSAESLTADGASLRTGGGLSVTSKRSMELSNADLDNTEGSSGITLTVNNRGDLSLVSTNLTSNGSATATVQSGDDSVNVTDARINDNDNFLEISPSAAATGEPAEGDAG